MNIRVIKKLYVYLIFLMDTEWFEKWIKIFPPDEKMTSNDNVEAFTGKNSSYNQLSMFLLKILFSL